MSNINTRDEFIAKINKAKCLREEYIGTNNDEGAPLTKDELFSKITEVIHLRKEILNNTDKMKETIERKYVMKETIKELTKRVEMLNEELTIAKKEAKKTIDNMQDSRISITRYSEDIRVVLAKIEAYKDSIAIIKHYLKEFD